MTDISTQSSSTGLTQDVTELFTQTSNVSIKSKRIHTTNRPHSHTFASSEPMKQKLHEIKSRVKQNITQTIFEVQWKSSER